MNAGDADSSSQPERNKFDELRSSRCSSGRREVRDAPFDADQVSDGRHALGLRLYAQGRPAEAMDELAVEVRERLRDSELLNDLGVLAADVGQAQVARCASFGLKLDRDKVLLCRAPAV